MRRARIVVYQDKAGEWRWRLRAGNGRIIADSGEGYTRKRDARAAVGRMIVAVQGIADAAQSASSSSRR